MLGSKTDLLHAICQNPGWAPSGPMDVNSAEWLSELETEGLIVSRLDGWEATATGLESYEQQWLTPVPEAEAPAARLVPGAEVTLDLLSIGVGQRIEVPIDKGFISGGIGLLNKGHRRVEVEVILRVRSV